MPQPTTFFEFTDISVDTEPRTIVFTYTVGFPTGKTKKFQETVTLSVETSTTFSFDDAITQRALHNLHLALGMSYWKLYCPKEIRVPHINLTKQQAAFWNTTYTKGLGEFFYTNQIDFRGLVQFPYEENFIAEQPEKISFSKRALLPFGGGKDSLVSLEILKEKKISFEVCAVNPHQLQVDLAKIIGKKLVTFSRTLDPQVFELVKNKEVYDGHVPITTFHMFLFLLYAVMCDYRYIVWSNEKSASYGNVQYLGEEINHQWSKSEEFERMFQSYVEEYVVRGISSFSILRPYYEIEIARQFAEVGQKYFSAFSSCNRNFRLLETRYQSHSLWCCHCPKCLFVFSLLAAFLPKQSVIAIFSKNLYADATLIPLYEELLGLRKFKPFECVGTPEEVRMAMRRALNREDYKDDLVLKTVAQHVGSAFQEKADTEGVFATYDTSMIPKEFV